MEGRVGTFSSSSIHKLVKSGRGKDAVFSAAGITYIKEKSYEIRLGQALNTEQFAVSTSWGHVLEPYAYAQIPGDILSLSSRLESKARRKHPKLLWTGASDFETKDTIGDIKSPYTRKSFCEQVDIYSEVEKGNLEVFKNEKPEYYWQLVSNSILANKEYAMAVVFLPTKDDVLEILSEDNLAYDAMNEHLSKCKERLKWLTLEDTPYLNEESEYKPLNYVKFKVPQEDKDFLIERVRLAEAELRELLK